MQNFIITEAGFFKGREAEGGGGCQKASKLPFEPHALTARLHAMQRARNGLNHIHCAAQHLASVPVKDTQRTAT